VAFELYDSLAALLTRIKRVKSAPRRGQSSGTKGRLETGVQKNPTSTVDKLVKHVAGEGYRVYMLIKCVVPSFFNPILLNSRNAYGRHPHPTFNDCALPSKGKEVQCPSFIK